MFNLTSVFAGVIGSFMTTIAKILGEETVAEAKKKVPGFLGLSFADEQIFINLRTELTQEENEHLTNFLMECSEYERRIFRMVVGGCVEEYEKISETTNTDGSKIVTSQKARKVVLFLKEIARLTKEKGAGEARRLCISGGVILENPLHNRIIALWKKGCDSAKDILSDPEVEQFVQDNIDQGKAFLGKAKDALDNSGGKKRNLVFRILFG